VALKRRPRAEPEINVASFSDIAFLLIIFFILTTTFAKPEGQTLQIPSGAPDKSKSKEEQPTVNLSSTGRITWG